MRTTMRNYFRSPSFRRATGFRGEQPSVRTVSDLEDLPPEVERAIEGPDMTAAERSEWNEMLSGDAAEELKGSDLADFNEVLNEPVAKLRTRVRRGPGSETAQRDTPNLDNELRGQERRAAQRQAEYSGEAGEGGGEAGAEAGGEAGEEILTEAGIELGGEAVGGSAVAGVLGGALAEVGLLVGIGAGYVEMMDYLEKKGNEDYAKESDVANAGGSPGLGYTDSTATAEKDFRTNMIPRLQKNPITKEIGDKLSSMRPEKLMQYMGLGGVGYHGLTIGEFNTYMPVLEYMAANPLEFGYHKASEMSLGKSGLDNAVNEGLRMKDIHGFMFNNLKRREVLHKIKTFDPLKPVTEPSSYTNANHQVQRPGETPSEDNPGSVKDTPTFKTALDGKQPTRESSIPGSGVDFESGRPSNPEQGSPTFTTNLDGEQPTPESSVPGSGVDFTKPEAPKEEGETPETSEEGATKEGATEEGSTEDGVALTSGDPEEEKEPENPLKRSYRSSFIDTNQRYLVGFSDRPTQPRSRAHPSSYTSVAQGDRLEASNQRNTRRRFT